MNPNFVVNPVAAVLESDLVSALMEVSTSLISDNLHRLEGVLGLQTFHSSRKLVGTAVTVKLRAGDNLLVYKAVSMMSPGHVLVVDAGGVTSNAIVGELLMLYAQQRGCAGFVIDGAIRDSATFAEADFPCYARAATHRGPYKTGPGLINVPVSIGGQVVQPGDVVVGDEDGLVTFPMSETESLLAAAECSKRFEQAIREEIATGAVRQAWMEKMFAAYGLT
ncbi:RraA family protein [Rhodocyclaceae bacterium SMB388]